MKTSHVMVLLAAVVVACFCVVLVGVHGEDAFNLKKMGNLFFFGGASLLFCCMFCFNGSISGSSVLLLEPSHSPVDVSGEKLQTLIQGLKTIASELPRGKKEKTIICIQTIVFFLEQDDIENARGCIQDDWNLLRNQVKVVRALENCSLTPAQFLLEVVDPGKPRRQHHVHRIHEELGA